MGVRGYVDGRAAFGSWVLARGDVVPGRGIWMGRDEP